MTGTHQPALGQRDESSRTRRRVETLYSKFGSEYERADFRPAWGTFIIAAETDPDFGFRDFIVRASFEGLRTTELARRVPEAVARLDGLLLRYSAMHIPISIPVYEPSMSL